MGFLMKQAIQSDRYAWWQYIMPPIFLPLFAALWYYPSLHYAFQFDDLANILKFFDIRHKTFGELFLSSTRWISSYLNTIYYKIGKFDPFAYRIGNVLEHCLSGVLLFFVLFLALKRCDQKTFFGKYAWAISFFTAALFLLHPVQTQTVTYVIQGQLEGLAGLFVLAIACLFMVSCTVHGLIRYVCLMLMCIVAFLSLGTKEIAIVSPLLVLLLDWFFVAQGNWQSLKQRWWVHALLAIIVFGTYFYLVKPHYFFSLFTREIKNNIGNVLTDNPTIKITMSNYALSQFKVIIHYMTIFIWPFSISVDYDWKIVKGFFAIDSFVPFIILLSLGIWILYRLRKNKIDVIAAAFLWFFIAILPRSSIVPSTELLADYKTYLASIGILFLIVCGSIGVVTYCTQNKYMQWFIGGVVLVVFGFLTYQRNLVWQSSCNFWENVIQNAPHRARAHNNYGVALSEKGEHAKAIESFKIAIRMDRNYSDPCNNIAVAYAALGKVDEAIAAIRMGLRINPYYPEGYNNLASFLMHKKEYEQAEEMLYVAIKLRPHYGKAYFNLGRLYLENGKKEQAYESFKQCCTKADFDTEIGFNAYGSVCVQLGKYDEAIHAYKSALACKPGLVEVQLNLANACFMSKRYQKAHDIYAHLYKNNPRDYKALFNLAESCFALGQFQRALGHYTTARTLNPHAPQPLIRSAACYKMLGDYAQARTLVEQVLASEAPAELKAKARELLQ